MKQPLELKALGINREISNLRIWAFRIYMLIAIPNAILSTASIGLAGMAGGVIGILIVSYGILYLLSNEAKERSPSIRETAD